MWKRETAVNHRSHQTTPAVAMSNISDKSEPDLKVSVVDMASIWRYLGAGLGFLYNTTARVSVICIRRDFFHEVKHLHAATVTYGITVENC